MKTIFLALFCSLLLSTPALSRCNDKKNVYKVCSDQLEIFNSASAKARTQNKMLIVNFGAEWCPWCHSLHKLFSNDQFKTKLGTKANFVDIALYKKRDKLASGQKVLKKLISWAESKVKMQGMPFIAILNPRNNKVTLLNTADLEQNTKTSKGHNSDKVFKALSLSMDSIK